MIYQKKPIIKVLVDAIQWNGDNINEILDHIANHNKSIDLRVNTVPPTLVLNGKELKVGDWVLVNDQDVCCWVLDNQTFQVTYEKGNQ